MTAMATETARYSPVLARQKSFPDPHRFFLWGTFGLLMFLPLAFGTVEPWSIFVMQATAASLLMAWIIQRTRSGILELVANSLFWPMLAFAILVIFQYLSGHTAYRTATIHQGLLYISYGLLCFLVAQCLRTQRQIRTVASALSIYGFSISLFALVQSASSNGKLYWVRTIQSGWIYGPYINHNHYAGLMEMLVPIPLVLSLSHGVHSSHRRMAVGAAAVMASTIFLSGSRGGMLAFAVQIVVLAGILLKRRTGIKGAWAMGIFLLLMLALLTWLGGSELTNRIAAVSHGPQHELSDTVRPRIDRDAIRMFTRHPFLGFGLGTFEDVYPQFRSFYTRNYIDQAHNDYLQLLDEMGVTGFAIMLWFLLALFVSAARKIRTWDRDLNGAAALAAMLGCTGILVHSLLDFNLHIPANSAWFYVLATIAALKPLPGGSFQERRYPE
jgi:O-antigen ligase